MSVVDSLTGLSLLLTINLKHQNQIFSSVVYDGSEPYFYSGCRPVLSGRVALRGYPISDINLNQTKPYLESFLERAVD